MSELEEFFEILHLIFILYNAYKCLRRLRSGRQFWVRDIYLDRKISGLYESTFAKLKNDPEQFRMATRMSVDCFNGLLNLLREDLTKLSIRTPISAECRLFVTLLYLAHGGSRQLHTLTHKMGLSTFRTITLETCDVIWRQLAKVYVSIPNETEWKTIASDFGFKWNMPNCLGAVDGKHINITCPPNSGSMFYNYKGQYSIVLLGVCDANYIFTVVDIGAYGSQSDGGIFLFSKFANGIEKGQLGIPVNKRLPNSDTLFPMYFVGDAAFPLKNYLMRPYPGKHLDEKSEYFNRRLSRARRLIENAFGILTAKWRILRTTLCMAPENAEKIVKAAVVLHNYVKLTDPYYIPSDYVDRYEGDHVINGTWREEVVPLSSVGRVSANKSRANTYDLRNNLLEYLFSNKI